MSLPRNSEHIIQFYDFKREKSHMPTLHIVRQSAYQSDDFAQCVNVLRSNDIIVFIDDGCYNIHHPLLATIDTTAKIELNIIKEHAQARAITINDTINIIEISKLVELTFTAGRTITWQ